MEQKQVTLGLPKEAVELGESVGDLVEVIAQRLNDGWQPLYDVPAIMTSAFQNLVKALHAITELPKELREDPIMFELAIQIPIQQAIRNILSKDYKIRRVE